MYNAKYYNVENLIEGNKKEFERIYIDFFDVLFALCFQYTHNRSVAEEIVQNVFLKLWEVKNTLRKDTNVRNFLFTVAKNNCLNYLRDLQITYKKLNYIKERRAYYNAVTLNNFPDDLMEYVELKGKVEKIIDELPEEIKKTFCMSRFEEMKYSEIAQKCQVSIKTVEARISKALKILRDELQDYLLIIILFFFLSSFFKTELFFESKRNMLNSTYKCNVRVK